MSIIAVIVAASALSINTSLQRSRDSRRYIDLESIKTALELHFQARSSYPNTGGQWWNICTNTTNDPSDHVADGGWIPGLAPTYIDQLPDDPLECSVTGGWFNGYIYRSNGTNYKLAGDWTTEVGEKCDNVGDEYYDVVRGPVSPSNGRFFCSISTPGAVWW
ncbi:MAG: hypothetical protein NUV98_01715 [Candidatus Roizmanbacteria bacterium]|nr:hypothetical protein [Candidatus Roizmanbacteria bacterium]